MADKIPETEAPGQPTETWAYASMLINHFGPDDAQHVAASSMYANIQAGDLEQFRAWKAVWAAIIDMTRTPVPLETIH